MSFHSVGEKSIQKCQFISWKIVDMHLIIIQGQNATRTIFTINLKSSSGFFENVHNYVMVICICVKSNSIHGMTLCRLLKKHGDFRLHLYTDPIKRYTPLCTPYRTIFYCKKVANLTNMCTNYLLKTWNDL